jgi:hypothetical protein
VFRELYGEELNREDDSETVDSLSDNEWLCLVHNNSSKM